MRYSVLLLLVWVTFVYSIDIVNQNSIEISKNNNETEPSLSIIILGASGDLSKRKIFPSLWDIWREGFLPKSTKIFGISRTEYTNEEFRTFISQNIKATDNTLLESFKSICYYFIGQGDSSVYIKDFAENYLPKHQTEGNRLFYLALPPKTFIETSTVIKNSAISQKGWNRIVIEKPFGHDLESSQILSKALLDIFEESQLFRIDHYLAKEMMQNILALRFANLIFEPLWNNKYIKAVTILMQEQIGTEGRGKYFDEVGIIRDVMQNHLLQMLALTAMEKPLSLLPEHIRDEKVKILTQIPEIQLNDVIIGQYTADDKGNLGYLDDKGVPPDSTTATFAQIVLNINNPRWSGVPFILNAAKAVREKKSEIRIQFQDVMDPLFSSLVPNELILRLQPNEGVYFQIMNKVPGLTESISVKELDLIYSEKFLQSFTPDAYARLLLETIRGDQSLFVRDDELREAWRIYTPLLHILDEKKANPILYPFGSSGPEEAISQAKSVGWVFSKSL